MAHDKPPHPSALDGATGDWLFLFRLGEEVDEVLLPDGGVGVGAVAAGGVGDGDKDELCVGHLRDHLFCDTKLRGIDEIVGGVDPEDGSGDGGELRCGVVVA